MFKAKRHGDDDSHDLEEEMISRQEARQEWERRQQVQNETFKTGSDIDRYLHGKEEV